MGGFDAIFAFHPDNLGVVQAMNAAARRRARALRVRWNSQATEAGDGYVVLDGNWYSLNILLERLRRDLPTVAEATPGRRTPAYRRRLGNGYADILIRSRGSWYERYDTGDRPFVPRLRAIQASTMSPVHSLWPGSGDHELGKRLAVSQTVMTSWCVGEVDAEVVLEELHTAAELLLKRLTGMPDKTKFSDLIRPARRQQVFGTHVSSAYPGTLTPQQLLKSLGRERNGSKHGGKATAETWLKDNFWPMADLLEMLSAKA